MLNRRGLWAGWALVLMLCAVFAFWPLEVARTNAPLVTEHLPEAHQVIALNGSAFRVPLWVADPAPTPESASVPPPSLPPLKLQLLAILREGGVYKAVVYDPDSDRLQILVTGDSVGSRKVYSVNGAEATLVDEAGQRTLSLKEGS